MHALFYQIKTQKSKNGIVFDEYYRNILENVDPGSEEDLPDKCRVCLREGFISIYGNDKTEEILEVLERYNNIHLNEEDDFPKYLCAVCYKFIKAAILFRKTAVYIDEILRKEAKVEGDNLDQSEDLHEFSDGSLNEKDSFKKPESEIQEIKREKRAVKCATKVTCHICNKIINRSYYKEHVTMHDPDHKNYVCDICGRSFRLRCAYYNHSLRHRTDFPYKCQFCPYRGRYAELLKTHMRTHTGDYRYMCTECPARFLFKSNLNSHMLKHKEPKFKCDTCKRAFHTKLMLQRHFEADHLGIKNHVCGMCGKAFGYRNAMMKHQRHVHKREKQLFGRMPAYLQADCENRD